MARPLVDLLTRCAPLRGTASAPLSPRSIILACSAALLGLACGTDSSRRPDELWGVRLPQPIEKPDFTLTSTDGTPFSFRAETDGFVTLLFFGYTHCPDVCPIHMANLAAVLQNLPLTVSSQIQVVMVTTDPGRDNPERLRTWLDGFDRSFVGLVGPLEPINEIQRGMGLPNAMRMGEGTEYMVGHASQVIAFTRDNLARVVYPFGTRQEDWAHDLPMLVRADQGTR